MKRKIIGICGFAGAGKDTIGDMLVEEFGFTKISFADKLKDACAVMFGWDREMLSGSSPESRKWREERDEFFSSELGRTITPRKVLQDIGTKCMRKNFHEHIWITFAKKTLLENPEKNYVFADVRFFNEQKMIRSVNGQIWRARRGKDPDWMQDAVNDNRFDTNWMSLNRPDVHETEWRWIDYPTEYDSIITNDGTLEDLKETVMQIRYLRE